MNIKIEYTCKTCIVPKCGNTMVNSPNKTFFEVPIKAEESLRALWKDTIGGFQRPSSVEPDIMYCCEDHFDLENDTTNYKEYCLSPGNSNDKIELKLHSHALPSRFECQNLRRNSNDIELNPMNVTTENISIEIEQPFTEQMASCIPLEIKLVDINQIVRIPDQIVDLKNDPIVNNMSIRGVKRRSAIYLEAHLKRRRSLVSHIFLWEQNLSHRIIIHDQKCKEIDIYCLNSDLEITSHTRSALSETSVNQVLTNGNNSGIKERKDCLTIGKSCCWFHRENFIKILQAKYPRTPIRFLRKPHSCDVNNCLCCCRYKLNRRPIEFKTFSETLSGWFEKLIACQLEPQEAIGKALSYVPKQNTPKVPCNKPENHKPMDIIINNEYYRIDPNGNIALYLKNVDDSALANVTKNIYLCNENVMYDTKVCCWFQRDKLAESLLKDGARPNTVKFLRQKHSCLATNCKCCCKPKERQRMSTLLLSITVRHTADINYQPKKIKINVSGLVPSTANPLLVQYINAASRLGKPKDAQSNLGNSILKTSLTTVLKSNFTRQPSTVAGKTSEVLITKTKPYSAVQDTILYPPLQNITHHRPLQNTIHHPYLPNTLHNPSLLNTIPHPSFHNRNTIRYPSLQNNTIAINKDSKIKAASSLMHTSNFYALNLNDKEKDTAAVNVSPTEKSTMTPKTDFPSLIATARMVNTNEKLLEQSTLNFPRDNSIHDLNNDITNLNPAIESNSDPFSQVCITVHSANSAKDLFSNGNVQPTELITKQCESNVKQNTKLSLNKSSTYAHRQLEPQEAIEKALSYVSRQNRPKVPCNKPENHKSMNIIINNEYYRIDSNGNIALYLKNVDDAALANVTKNIYLCNEYVMYDTKVCCWFKRDKIAESLLKDGVRPNTVKFIKQNHSCLATNCKCCCKPKEREKNTTQSLSITGRNTADVNYQPKRTKINLSDLVPSTTDPPLTPYTNVASLLCQPKDAQSNLGDSNLKTKQSESNVEQNTKLSLNTSLYTHESNRTLTNTATSNEPTKSIDDTSFNLTSSNQNNQLVCGTATAYYSSQPPMPFPKIKSESDENGSSNYLKTSITDILEKLKSIRFINTVGGKLSAELGTPINDLSTTELKILNNIFPIVERQLQAAGLANEDAKFDFNKILDSAI